MYIPCAMHYYNSIG